MYVYVYTGFVNRKRKSRFPPEFVFILRSLSPDYDYHLTAVLLLF